MSHRRRPPPLECDIGPREQPSWRGCPRKRRKREHVRIKLVSVERPVRVRLAEGMKRPTVCIDAADGALVVDFTS